MVADRPSPTFSETDQQLRGIATALGELGVELPKTISDAAATGAAVGSHIEASIDQVATEISDLTAAVRELTELVKEMAVFPRQSTTRRVLHWITRR